MWRQIRRHCSWVFLSAALAVAGLSGCANTGGTGSRGCTNCGEEVDPKLSGDDASFFSESGGMACLGGVFVGALVGMLACNSENRAACMVGGAGAGCLVGLGANYGLDKLRENYKTREEQLNAAIKVAEEDNKKARNFAKASADLVNKDRAALADLESKLNKGSVTLDELGRKLRGMDKNIEYMRSNLAKARERLSAHQEVRNGLAGEGASNSQRAAYLDKKIAEMRESIAVAENSLKAYTSQRNALAVRINEKERK